MTLVKIDAAHDYGIVYGGTTSNAIYTFPVHGAGNRHRIPGSQDRN